MLRSVFHLLVRLHPRAFRERFAAEMLSIFDHSTGKNAAFSLVFDAWLSLLRQWGFRFSFWNDAVAVEQPQAVSAGAPSFLILETSKLRGIALIQGGILSLVFFIVISLSVLNSRGSKVQPRLPKITPDSLWGSAATEKSPDLAIAIQAARARNSAAAPDAHSVPPRQNRTASQQSVAQAGSLGIATSASPDSAPLATLAPSPSVSDDSSPQNSWQIVSGEDSSPVPRGGQVIGIVPAPPLPSYEGTYIVNPPNSFKVEITAEGDQLFLSSPDKPKTALVPCSETSFRFQDSTVCGMTFSKFNQGEFHQLAILQGNIRYIALR